MNHTPKISIIVPVYNGERYLEECIRSIFNQTYSDFEIIVVDDTSTDSTPVILERLQAEDSRLRIIRNEKNLGTGGSRNAGIKESRGELIALLDGDDSWYPNYFEVSVPILDANPDIGCLFSDFDFMDENSRITNTGTGRYDYPGETPPLTRIGLDNIWENKGARPLPSAVIFRKEALLEVMPFRDGYCEDINVWLKFAVRHSFVETGLILVTYRKHQSQQTGHMYKLLLARTEAFLDAVRACPEIPHIVGPKSFAKVMYKHTAATGNYWFWMQQDYPRAAGYLKQAYRYKPTDLGTLIKLLWCWTPLIVRKYLRSAKASLTKVAGK